MMMLRTTTNNTSRKKSKKRWTVSQETKGGGVQVVRGISKKQKFELRGSKNVPEDVQLAKKKKN